ncbi:aspartyl-phosphate phosphatase Spo0E family protein [Pseudalkalibacillus berkeleyi]|uniref:Aspartyl-phosphate phosphatase Spo0E family protein n=1 Tax=Pseudalkalibacillus berkeleyi TaxID=1069813 RepID=A0ABS9H3A3_9BACL|nr:aspartyl-phosphate phosphatase Spo0E family protein [Pseudalkalibacillus berkeleyi]MCF6139429.1 aspartyl-phosphate phosphatase Spo0E family protein [Pseudalkalibacillus berkeleyi]
MRNIFVKIGLSSQIKGIMINNHYERKWVGGLSAEERYLLKEIETSRKRMLSLAKEKPLFSTEVVEISQYLDDLLNRYDVIKSEIIQVS